MKIPSRNTTFTLTSLLAVMLVLTFILRRSFSEAPSSDSDTASVAVEPERMNSASAVSTSAVTFSAQAVGPSSHSSSSAMSALGDSSPIIPGTQSHPTADAPPGKASIALGERSVTPPNYGGHYERVAITPKQEVSVQLSWPEDHLSEGVFVHAIQGGTIDGERGKNLPFDSNRSVRFAFMPTAESGLFQVLVRRGTAEEVLNFWVPTNRPASDPHAL